MKLNLDNISINDLTDFVDLQENHKLLFLEWCDEHKHAGADDQLDWDLDFMGKAFDFFFSRGYIK